MALELLTVLVLLGCWAAGTLITLAVQVLRPLLLRTKKRLEEIGGLIYQAVIAFRDSDVTPPELDDLLTLILNKWGLLSRSAWSVTGVMLDELESVAGKLRAVLLDKRLSAKRSVS
jgi:hypothetical protein